MIVCPIPHLHLFFGAAWASYPCRYFFQLGVSFFSFFDAIVNTPGASRVNVLCFVRLLLLLLTMSLLFFKSACSVLQVERHQSVCMFSATGAIFAVGIGFPHLFTIVNKQMLLLKLICIYVCFRNHFAIVFVAVSFVFGSPGLLNTPITAAPNTKWESPAWCSCWRHLWSHFFRRSDWWWLLRCYCSCTCRIRLNIHNR